MKHGAIKHAAPLGVTSLSTDNWRDNFPKAISRNGTPEPIFSETTHSKSSRHLISSSEITIVLLPKMQFHDCTPIRFSLVGIPDALPFSTELVVFPIPGLCRLSELRNIPVGLG